MIALYYLFCIILHHIISYYTFFLGGLLRAGDARLARELRRHRGRRNNTTTQHFAIADFYFNAEIRIVSISSHSNSNSHSKSDSTSKSNSKSNRDSNSNSHSKHNSASHSDTSRTPSSCTPAAASSQAAATPGFYYHFKNLRFKQSQITNYFSDAHVVMYVYIYIYIYIYLKVRF